MLCPTRGVEEHSLDEVFLPSDLKTRVDEVLECIRPYIQAEGGYLRLRGVDETTGVVEVSLRSACSLCPSASMTLKNGVELMLKEQVSGVTGVIVI